MDESIRKLLTARRILTDGGDDCKKDLDELTGLSIADRRKRLDETFRNILRKMAEYLYDAAKLFSDQHPREPLQFYFWPGYDSILRKDQHSRITLTCVSGIREISCGIAFPASLGRRRIALSSTSAWYHRVLEAYDNDIYYGEPFTPGSMHFWVAKQRFRLRDGSEEGGPFNVLAIEGVPSSGHPRVDLDSGFFRVPIDLLNPTEWVQTIETSLNDQEKVDSEFLWPIPVPPCEPIRIADKARLEKNGDLRKQHEIRLKLYSIWLLASLSPKYNEQRWAWIGEFASEIGSDLPDLAARIRDGLVSARRNELLAESPEYRCWYTILLERIPSLPSAKGTDELGSAMILSSHEIPVVCLSLMQSRIQWIYLLMRYFEESILIAEAALDEGKAAGQESQANESAHEATAQLSSAATLLDYVKMEANSEVTNYIQGSIAYAQLFLSPKPELSGIENWILAPQQRADEWLKSCISMAWRICVAREARGLGSEEEVFGEHGLVDINRIPLNCIYRITPSSLSFEPAASLESEHRKLRWDLSKWVLASLSNAIKWSGLKGDEKLGMHLLQKWSRAFQAQGSSPFKETVIILKADEGWTELTVCNGFSRRWSKAHEKGNDKEEGTPRVLKSIQSRLPRLEDSQFRLMNADELLEYLPTEHSGFISRIRLHVRLFQRTIE